MPRPCGETAKISLGERGAIFYPAKTPFGTLERITDTESFQLHIYLLSFNAQGDPLLINI